MFRSLKLVFLSALALTALVALTGCPGGGNNAQTPATGCGAPGQPPCINGNNLQCPAIGQIWNGTACVTSTLSPGGYIHYFGALSNVDGNRTRDIIGTLQGCRKYIIFGSTRPCYGSIFDYNAGSVDIYLYPTPTGHYYQVSLTIGGSKYLSGVNYPYGTYGTIGPYNNPYGGTPGRAATGMDLIGQAAYYPTGYTGGSQLTMQYYGWKIDVITPVPLDGTSPTTLPGSVQIKIDGAPFAVTELSRLPN
jgi:hypothetical protein